MGKIIYIAPAGQYSPKFIVLELEFQGAKKQFTLLQTWPVHTPRLVSVRLAAATFITGQCVLEALFYWVLAGICNMLSAFDFGKTMASRALSLYSNLDYAIYVDWGESESEIAEELMDFPQLTMTLPERHEEFVMKNTTLVANTLDMSVAAHEASVAEYFRYTGYNISMMADSTCHWVRA
ncbi:hypothetical protein P3S68_026464 [Capsicum galapagoense]